MKKTRTILMGVFFLLACISTETQAASDWMCEIFSAPVLFCQNLSKTAKITEINLELPTGPLRADYLLPKLSPPTFEFHLEFANLEVTKEFETYIQNSGFKSGRVSSQGVSFTLSLDKNDIEAGLPFLQLVDRFEQILPRDRYKEMAGWTFSYAVREMFHHSKMRYEFFQKFQSSCLIS